MRNGGVLTQTILVDAIAASNSRSAPLKCQRFVFTRTSESIAMANTISNIRLCILSTSFHIKPIPWRSRYKRYHWDLPTWILTLAINFLQIGRMSGDHYSRMDTIALITSAYVKTLLSQIMYNYKKVLSFTLYHFW